jgi:GTP-binding protein
LAGPNVGKSSLLNALAHKLISIVQDMPGVTRDRVSTPLAGWEIGLSSCVDTGGYGFDDPQLDRTHQAPDRTGHEPGGSGACYRGLPGWLTRRDQQIARMPATESIKTVLVANKTDSEKARRGAGRFRPPRVRHADRSFGAEPAGSTRISSDHQVTSISQRSKGNARAADARGDRRKRNAGKSTLVNAIAGIYEDDADRVIVSEVPGTPATAWTCASTRTARR